MFVRVFYTKVECKMKKYKFFIYPAIILGIALLACTRDKVQVGKPAPDFKMNALGSIELENADLRGTYTLIYFWGTWSEPCRAENPALMEVYQQFQEATFDNGFNFNILGIALNSNESDCRRVIREDKLRIRYHVLDNSPTQDIFDAPLAKLFGVTKLPTRILMDGEGVVIGVDLSVAELEQLLRSKLL